MILFMVLIVSTALGGIGTLIFIDTQLDGKRHRFQLTLDRALGTVTVGRASTHPPHNLKS